VVFTIRKLYLPPLVNHVYHSIPEGNPKKGRRLAPATCHYEDKKTTVVQLNYPHLE
jgi:hypothetical protein